MSKPRINIPEESDPESPEYINVRLRFDEPLVSERDDYTLWYYNVDDLDNGEEAGLTVSKGLFNKIDALNPRKGTELAIANLGSRRRPMYIVKHTGGPGGGDSPPPQPSGSSGRTSAPSSRKIKPLYYEPMTQDQMNVMLACAQDYLEAYEAMLALVHTRERLEDMTDERKAQLATSLMIHALRSYMPGMKLKPEEGDEPDIYAQLADMIEGKDGLGKKKYITLLLDSYAELVPDLSREQIINFISSIGLESERFLNNEKLVAAMLEMLLDIKTAIENGSTLVEASTAVAIDNGFEYDEFPF